MIFGFGYVSRILFVLLELGLLGALLFSPVYFLFLRKRFFARRLVKESRRWVAEGLISPETVQDIAALYMKPRPHDPKRTIRIVFVMAAILLGVGVILFYAANWKGMPPAAKTIQVFLLVIGSYAAAYYFMAVRQGTRAVGRVLLFVGMCSYGAGIALIAQIFHISAHPANGVLLWSIGVLLLAGILEDTPGLWLAGVLMVVWDVWEVQVYGNANPAYLILPLVLAVFFYRVRRPLGLVFCAAQILWWFTQVNAVLANRVLSGDEAGAWALALFAFLPFGAVLAGIGQGLVRDPYTRLAARVLRVAGLAFMSVPFFGLSWPIAIHPAYPVYVSGNLFFTIELVVLAALTELAWRLGSPEMRPPAFFRAAALFALIPFVVPLGSKAALMVATHLGLVAFLFGLLLFAFGDKRARYADRFFAVLAVALALAVKAVGFFSLGLSNHKYYAAYCLGFIVFGTVVFLVGRAAALVLQRKNRFFPERLVTAACGVAGYLILYALSFEVKKQASIFTADAVVLTLLFVFLGLAGLLYLILGFMSRDRLPLALSAVVFFPSVVMLFLSGPGLSATAYQVVFNLLIMILLGTTLYASVARSQAGAANLAILGFAILVVTRYFDLFWELLSGSLLFLATGVLALVGGWLLEKNRRKLVARMRTNGEGGGS